VSPLNVTDGAETDPPAKIAGTDQVQEPLIVSVEPVPGTAKLVLALAAVEAPVPPSATAKSVMLVIVPPEIVAEAVERLERVARPVVVKVLKRPVEAVVAPIGTFSIVPPLMVAVLIVGLLIVGEVRVLPVRVAVLVLSAKT
jgi:hypothetical protein